MKIGWRYTIAVAGAILAHSSAFANVREGIAADLPREYNERAPENCDGCRYIWVHNNIAPAVGAIINTPDPVCRQSLNEKAVATDILQGIISSAGNKARLAKFAGEFAEMKAVPAIRNQLASMGGDVAKFLSKSFMERTNRGTCVTFGGWLPGNAEIVGYRYKAYDIRDGTRTDCGAGTDCGFGWARFPKPLQYSKDSGGGGTSFVTTFMNWSHDRDRDGSVIVFYRLPPGEVPLRQL